MIINILILGEPGELVRLLINKALETSYNVTAMLSKPTGLTMSHPNLEIIKGEVHNYEDMKSAIAGQDAVIWAYEKTTNSTIGIGTQNMILAMNEMKVRRLVCLSSIGSGSSSLKMGVAFQLIMYLRGNSHLLEAKGEQEKMLSASKLDFSMVQVGMLHDHCADAVQIKVIQAGLIDRTFFTHPGSVCRKTVANFMISQLESAQWQRQTVCLFPVRVFFGNHLN